jgi:ubiquinone/menaquinone biosynthesis C-methylase UbiE
MDTFRTSRDDMYQQRYQEQRTRHWDGVARSMSGKKGHGQAYHSYLEELYAFIIPPGKRVLEVGCAQGDLLAAVKPARGVGIDFSPEMVREAQRRYPDYHFLCMDAHDISLQSNEWFDFIILSDLVNDLWDVQKVLGRVARFCLPQTRIVLNFFNKLWELPLRLVRRFGLANPLLPQNWLTVGDIRNMLYLADFEVISCRDEILFPLSLPFATTLANRFLARLWPFRLFALTHFLVARPRPTQGVSNKHRRVSVIVPARNEAGNIPDIFERLPEMGEETELIFVEGHSRDNTLAVIEKAMAEHPERRCKLLVQLGEGKGDAVRKGFAEARGEVLMILDADLTVSPESLPCFYEALHSGKADFVNGVRLVYPLGNQAMRFLNLVGNKSFSVAFTWLLGQPIKDTLCGTKALWKWDYESIVANRPYFGNFDPFGDFDLLFGAAKLGLKIVDLPVRYGERTYGKTNIQRWRHGWLLMRMVVFAARRLKFV